MARRTPTVASRTAGPAAPLTRAALRAQVPADIDRASSGVPPARGAAPGGPAPRTPSRAAVVFDDVSDVSPSSSSSGSVLLCNGPLPPPRPAPRTNRTRLVPPPVTAPRNATARHDEADRADPARRAARAGKPLSRLRSPGGPPASPAGVQTAPASADSSLAGPSVLDRSVPRRALRNPRRALQEPARQ